VRTWPARAPVGDPGDPRGFETLVERYLESLAVRHCSPMTIIATRRLLQLFAAWCAERGALRPAEITRAQVERYQRWLFHYRTEADRPLRIGSQRNRLNAVQLYFAWLTRERYLAVDPASALVLPHKPRKLPTASFTVSEVEQVLAAPNVAMPAGLRDRAILETLYSTGIRRSELVHLDVYDIDRDRGWLTVRQGKGSKDRVVPIGERALAWLGRYLEEARPQLVLAASESALFLNREGARFTPNALSAQVRRIIERSGVREREGSCHLFRHTCATLMLEGGADTRFLQEMLGHASLDSTQIYTRVSIEKLKAIHTATHPGAKLERRKVTDFAES
jgi:integrase/recombinase XerD